MTQKNRCPSIHQEWVRVNSSNAANRTVSRTVPYMAPYDRNTAVLDIVPYVFRGSGA